MAVSSASSSTTTRTWASAAPNATSSAAPSVRSTMAAPELTADPGEP